MNKTSRGEPLSLVAVFLCIAQLFWGVSAPSLFASSTVEKSELTFEGGEVTYQSPLADLNLSKIFLIEDAHASFDAQESIRLLLRQLKQRYPDAKIFVEGTEGPINWDVFWRFPLKESREIVSRYFLEKGRMSGAEVYSAAETNGEILYGLEKKEAHQENVQAYLEGRVFIPKGKKGLEQFEEGLDKLKGIYYTPVVRKWEREYGIFSSPSGDLLRYLKFLGEWSEEEGVSLKSYSHIEKIIQLGKKPSAESLKSLQLEKRAFAIDLFNEKNDLEAALFEKTKGPETLTPLLLAERRLELLKKLISLELSHREWETLKGESLRSEVDSLKQFLIPFAGQLKMDLSHGEDFRLALEAQRKFYEKAKTREQFIFQNLEEGMARLKTSTAIVIAGGFHAEGFREYFQDKKYSLTQISPVIRDVNRTVPYWEIFEGKRTPLEAWFSGQEILSGAKSRNAYLVAKETAGRGNDFLSSTAALLLGVHSQPVIVSRNSGETVLVDEQISQDGRLRVDLKPFGTKSEAASLGNENYPYKILIPLGQAVIESPDLRSFANQVIDILRGVVSFDTVDLAFVDSFDGHSGSLVESYLPPIALHALPLDEPYYVHEVSKASLPIPGYSKEELTALGIEDLYIVPLMGREKKTMAFLILGSKVGKVIAEQDRLFLRNIGGNIAAGIIKIDSEERLKKSEMNYRHLFENAPTGFHVLNSSGFIVDVNQKEAEMLGYTPAEMIDQLFTNFIVPEERENAMARFRARLDSKPLPPRKGDRHYLNKDGRRLAVATKDTIMRDTEGKVIRIQTSLRDITERRESEILLDGLSRLMNEMNKQGAIEDVYRVLVEEATRLLGFDRAGLNLWFEERNPQTGNVETVARVDYQYHANPETIPSKNPRGKVIRSGEASLTAQTLRKRTLLLHDYRKDSIPITESARRANIAYSVSLPIYSDERIIGNIIFSTGDPKFSLREGSLPVLERLVSYLSVAIERKQAEEELAQSRLRLQYMLDALPFAILMRGVDSKPEYANATGTKFFDISPESAKKSGIMPVVFPLDHKFEVRYRTENDRVLKNGELIDEEEEVAKEDKRLIYHKIKQPLRDEHGNIFGMLEIYEDVTQIRESQSRAKNAEKWEATTLMAGQIAHDFNNLLVSPLAEPDLIRSRLQVGEPVEENLTRIQNSATTMQEIARELLTLSKIGKAHFEPLDFSLVVKQIAGVYQNNFPGVYFDVAGLDVPHYIKGHMGQLGQVVSNLVVNASDAMTEKGGRLTLKMEEVALKDSSEIHQSVKELKLGKYVKLTVKDTGHGIPAAILPKIFDPFFSTKQADARRGSGLGLSTVKGVLESHGGFIDVRTAEGKGTEFHAYLPVSDERPRPVVMEKRELTKGKGLVWVIDDELSVRELAVDVLKDAGYQVVDFESGTAAVKAAEFGETMIPDLVLSDMRMEGNERAGLEAYVGIKKALKLEALKGIMMSGNVSGETVADSKKAGFSRFLGKPFRLAELLDAVGAELALDSAKTPATKNGVETLLIVEDTELIGDVLVQLSRMWKPSLKVEWAKTATEALRLVNESPAFDVIYLDQNLPDGTGTEVFNQVEANGKRSPFTRVIYSTGSGSEEAPFRADVSLQKPFDYKVFTNILKKFDGEMGGQSLGKNTRLTKALSRLEKNPLLKDYFKAVYGDEGVKEFLRQAYLYERPLALVFSWKALQEGSMAEELKLLFDLMPNLKIFVSTEGPVKGLEKELALFDPNGILTEYREWDAKKQLNLLGHHTIQRAKTKADFHVGGISEESSLGVFVMGGDEEEVQFLGTSKLHRFVATARTSGGKEGRLVALPALGIQTILGVKELPENVRKNSQGFFEVYALSLGEISAELTRALLSRTAFAQAA